MRFLDRFRPPSVHRLADELRVQLVDADPDARMLDAFRREGRCDGRRARSPDPLERYVVEAVELATSQLAERFVDELRTLDVQIRKLEEALGVADNGLRSAGLPDRSEAVTASAARGPREADAALGGALERMAAAKQRRAADAAAARRQEREAQFSALQSELAAQTEERAHLHERYRQQLRSTHEAGQVIWSRYCKGYAVGAKGSKTGTGGQPNGVLEFETPAPLAG